MPREAGEVLRSTISSSEASRRLGLSRERVVRLAQRGILGADVSPEGFYRIDERSVEELLFQALSTRS